MAPHLEFVVQGPPLSNQTRTSRAKANLKAWQAKVAGEAQIRWVGPMLPGTLKATLINFHTGDIPSVDVDNMSKPILDALGGIVYVDDRQIRQAEIVHVGIRSNFLLAGVSRIIADALQVGTEFVYVRIEEPIDPFPLPG